MTTRTHVNVAIGVCGLIAGCASSPPPARAPVAQTSAPAPTTPIPPPMAAAPAPSTTNSNVVSKTNSNVVISDEIRAACGIRDEDSYFAFDSANIREQDHRVLSELSTCFDSGPLEGRQMLLVGRADPRGSGEFNMVLGEHRARGVKDYLATLGLASNRIETTSRGKMDATGTHEAAWALDRRVDVELVPAPLGCGPNRPAGVARPSNC
jgi:outer membrane protein OmpA-like peptidoglycan-associated protein